MEAKLKLKRILLASTIFSALIFGFLVATRAAPSDTLYWENPVAATNMDSRFPQTITDDENMYVFFEEVDKKSQKLWISLISRKENELKWKEPKRIAGPFDYSGDEIPDIYTVAKSKDSKKIALSVQTSKKSLGVYTSSDKCASFKSKEFSEPVKSLIGPRIFGTSTGGFMLFASLGETADGAGSEEQASAEQNIVAAASNIGSFTMLASRSTDGENWTQLSEFLPAANVRNPFVPYLAEFYANGKTGDVVFFQGFAETSAIFQLFMATSFDGQRTWSQPKAMTVHPQYRNQRPCVFTVEMEDGASADGSSVDPSIFAEESTTFNFDTENENGPDGSEGSAAKAPAKAAVKKTFVAWERTETKSDRSQIMFAEVNEDGTFNEETEITTNGTGGSAHRPAMFKYNGKLSIVWFDDRKGVDGIYMAQRSGKFWSEKNLVSLSRNSEFAYPIILGDELAFAWQQAVDKDGNGRIYVLETDRSVQAPKIAAASFTEGGRSTSEKVSAKVQLPKDSSGIAGYTWIWTRNRKDEPPKDLNKLVKPKSTTMTANATDDGIWYFKARAYDYAGNWSESATLSYYRDLTPPQPPIIDPVETDKYGFVKSENFTMTWKGDEMDDDVAGYSWSLTPIGRFDRSLNVNKTHPMRLSQAAAEKKVAEIILKYTEPKELKKWEKATRPPRKMMGSFPK